MSRSRVLYHLVRADFLERVRRYSFLVTLGSAVYLGYCCVTGKVVVRLDQYRGVFNSAWVGSVTALCATMFLTLIGFYIVKNTIQRDEQTRVGQILATTPMTKSFYTIAKMISNFAVLAAMVAVMACAAALMQLVKAEDAHLHLWALLSPFLIIALPAIAFTSALAVLFETLPVLRGGVGNVVYFFVWTALLATPVGSLHGTRVSTATYYTDFTGIVSVMGQMQADLHAIDPEYKNGAALTIGDTETSKKFLWTGLRNSPALYLSRLTCVLAAFAIAWIAAFFFHRFDPAREWAWKKKARQSTENNFTAPANGDRGLSVAPPPVVVRLTAVTRKGGAVSLPSLVLAELKLMLKGHRWWWYVVAGGLFVASLASPLNAVHSGVAVVALIWPTLVWSQMGTREARFNTASLIFSSGSTLTRQLPAVWIAGVLVALITNGGLGIRLAMAHDREGLLAWLACTLFVPSLALALGVWSGTSKVFEAVYTAWWYAGPANHAPDMDFLGTTRFSTHASLYFALAAALVVVAFLGRRAKLAYA